MRKTWAIAAAIAIAGLGGCRTDGAANSAAAATTVPLTVRTATGEHRFRVEVARTGDEQSRGLMFRTSLAPDAGMIFPMTPPRQVSFWMRNVPIPLDIIFVRPDGTIATIAAEATPQSLALRGSGEPVSLVLEIAGGRAAELGISEGDTVSWSG